MVTTNGRRRRVRAALALASATVLVAGASVPAAFASDDGDDHGDHGSHNLSATLTGAKERPGPGDPDGRGNVRIQLKHNQICFQLSWRNIDAPTAAHIHLAPRDQSGPVVQLLLSAPGGLGGPVSEVRGCAMVDHMLVHNLHHNPGAYYVNIHNAAFPAGAIRGQLRS